MSVDSTAYTVFGIKTKYREDILKKIPDDKSDEFYDEFCISDHMCGEYMVFGKILLLASCDEGNEFIEIDIPNLPAIRGEYLMKAALKFPELIDFWEELSNKEFKLISFIHYS